MKSWDIEFWEKGSTVVKVGRHEGRSKRDIFVEVEIGRGVEHWRCEKRNNRNTRNVSLGQWE